ncbi:TPA: hypothetical protein DCZ46_00070 [Candidatus Campbellbacteria bacterium]|uniref:Uncharacterized protein n=1 Tax=Candidatus Campbellbacteria bacterium RIFCSPLOWO2_01_FULL_34_15 TaxID=1797579 RepID=A0A1F5EQ60_9BACT|nr:MAG: protein of unknown function with transmembrane region [Candidatus Campbellbacteria bacterium GW2011_OD1_34_28]KKP74635.1 MAG: hypothetical protein UR74_C0003G0045 [Candidatus Campbellbacteria bacterium GW2011_GWD2_35_24]KKP76767.1 MAG: hypothetical protein UR76_C0003G0045 [Candidatus Campbellbacteria bacterium GW2011_GWC1_35_31]KKP78662.1 MAG: hypothetical protein UR79_C0003G0016 [Candidatus Campbellbacteria bacterium GW2011_GWD1_35_49]OGD69523.1 MAG: hypothetical protein A2996_03605 [C
MSQVKFEEFQSQSSYRGFDDTSKMVKWVIKYSGGFIKSKIGANYFLLGVFVVFTILSLFTIFSSAGKDPLNGEVPVDQIIP